jgi:hypothetical protein
MKLVMVSVHFEYTDAIADIIDRHAVDHYLVYSDIKGRDSEGFHEGSQVHPGNLTALHMRMYDKDVDALLDDLNQFRVEKKAHNHLEAMVMNIERWIGPGERVPG